MVVPARNHTGLLDLSKQSEEFTDRGLRFETKP